MWQREDHMGRKVRTQAAVSFDVIEIGDVTLPTSKAPVPEQDARQLARRQKHNAGCFSRDELVALAWAQEALEVRESIVDRAARWLREWMEGLRP
jgi:hypothetical protein